MNIILIMLGIALIIGFAELLLYVAQSRKKKYLKLKFFGLLFSPYILIAIFSLNTPQNIAFVTNNLMMSYLIGLLSIAYLSGWAYTLYKVAGEYKRRWFYTILIINIMFLFYLFVEDE